MAKGVNVAIGVALAIYVLSILPYSIFAVWNLPMEYTYFNTPGAPDGDDPKSARYGFEWWVVSLLTAVTVAAPLVCLFSLSRYQLKWEGRILFFVIVGITILHLVAFITLSVIWGNATANNPHRGIAQDRLYCCAKWENTFNDCDNTSPCTAGTDVNGDPLVVIPTTEAQLSTTREFRTLYFFTLGFLALDASYIALNTINKGYGKF